MTDDLSRGEYAGNAADTAASGAAQGGWSNPDVVVAQNDTPGAGAAQGNAAIQGQANQAATSGAQDQAAQDQATQNHGGQGAPAAQDQAADAGAQQQAAPGDQANAAQVDAAQANTAALGGDIGPVATDGTVSVHRPGPGETVIYDIAQGEHINVQFDPDAAIFRIVGDDFILNFGDGGRLVFEGFVPAAQSGHPPQLDIGGQQVAADALVNQALAFNEGLQFPQTAAGPALLGGGGHNYSDDLGSLIGLLNPEGVIPPVNMGFGLIRLLPGGGLSEENGTPGITITPETPTPPVVPTPHVPGGSTGNGEHPTPGPNGQVVFHGGGFEDAEPNQHVGDTSVHPTQLIVDFLPSGSEVLTSLTISGVPAGSTFMVGGTDAGNVVTVTNGSVTLTADQVNSGLFVIPPHDADQDIPLTATAQFTNNGQTGTVTGTTTVIVDAVADKPHDLSATPDHSSVVEGHNVTFAVHATFGDFTDGSESHSVLVELQSGWANPQGYATETISAGNIFGVPAGTYVIVPVANGGIAPDGSVTVNVTLQAPGSVNAPTTFQFDVAGKAQETNLSGGELTTDNNVSYTPSTTPAEVTVIKTPGGNITVTTETTTPPVTPTGDVPGGSTGNGQHPTPGPNGQVVFHGGGFEDAEPNQHIGDTSVHPIQIIPTFTPVGSEVLTSLTISGIPTGSTFLVGGTAQANVVTVTNGSVTLTPAQVASGLFMIPPHDADQDIPLNVSGQFREPSTGVTGTVSGTTTAVVDAVADKPHDVGGTADHPAVVEGQAVTFAVHATFGDFVDGSESHSVLVQLQSGWGNPQGYATETIPAGNIFGVPAGTYVIVPVANSAIAPDGTITANVTLTAPGHVQGVQTYELNVAGKAQETVLSGGELTTDNNVSYTPSATPVEVKVVHPGANITVTTETTTPPVVPTGDVPGGSTGNGQHPTPGPNGQVVFHGGGFEDAEPNQHIGDTSIHPIQIIPTFTPVSGEVLTSLTISGIPTGATFLVGGTDAGHAVTVTNGGVTLTPAQVASGLFMIPPHDADQDIPLNVSGQFREPLTGATGTVSGTTTAVVDAVADKPHDVTGAANHPAVTEGQAVTFAVHATFGDFVDGSESHSVLVELQFGWGNPQGYATETIPAGNVFGVPAGTYVIVPVANSAIAPDGTITANVTLAAPGHVQGVQTYELNVAGKAQEVNLSGGELTTDNNVSYTPSNAPVEVKVVHPGANITVTTETTTPPVVPTGDVPGGSTGNGQHPTPGPNGQVVFHGGGFEDAEPNQHVGDTSVHPIQIIPTFTPVSGEVLTSLTISGIPTGATFLVGGTDAGHAVTVTNGSLTLTPAQVASGLFMIPPHDADQDIPLNVSGQFREPLTGATGTVSSTTTAIVDAVADKPHDVGGTPDHSTVHEGGNVTLAVHATFGDFTDGSEAHSVLVQLQQGWGNPQGYATETIPAGNIFGVPAGTYVVVPVANSAIAPDGTVTVNVTLTTPNNLPHSAEVDLNVVAKAQETVLSGGELTTDNNVSYTPSPTPVHVKVSNGEPLANPGKDAVYEAGLPNGTDSHSGHNVATGFLSIDYGPAGPGSVVSFVSHNSDVQVTDNGSSFVVNGGYFIMTVDKATGDYVATLLHNTLEHQGVNLVNDQDVIPKNFTYTITDADGNTSSSTFTLNIADDGPAAYDDDASVKKGGTVTGNVMDNDQQGADSAIVTQVSGHAVGQTGDTVVQGTYGTLTIHADGSYSYVADHVNQAGTVTDHFTYKITDLELSHGDSAQANLDITIQNNVPTGGEDSCTVREAGINGHDVFSAGTDAASNSENASGTLHYSFGPDAAASTGAFAWSTHVTAADGDANGHFTGLTSGGDAVQFRVEDGGHTIIGFVPDSASGPYAGHDVLKLTVADPSTGAFSYQQLGPIDHPDNAATVGGVGETEAQDPVNLTFGYTVKDADGDTANGHLTVKVLDDGPIAKPDTFSVEEPVAKTYKLVYVVDVSNSMNETLADGSTKLDAAKTAFAALNHQAVQAGLGDAEVLLVAFNNGVQGVMQFSHASDPGLGSAIDQLVATNGTKYEPAFNVVSDWLGGQAIDAGIPGASNTTVHVRAGGDVDSRVFFLSDGGNNNSAGGWDPTYGNVENLYGNVGNPANDLVNVTIKSVGFGIGQTDPAYQVLDLTDNNLPDHSAQVVETNAGAAGIQGAFGQVLPEGTVTGNVLHNDQFGADGKVNGGGLISIQIDNATYDAHAAVGGHVVSNANGVLVVNTALGGQLTFNFNNGDFTYKAPSQVPGDKTEDFKYTIRDGDGDLARTDLKINVLHQPPQAHDDQANVAAGEQKTGKLVYVVDTSESMGHGLANGATKLDAAKTAFNALNQQAIAAGFGGAEVLIVAFNAGVQSIHQFSHADDPAISSYISGLTAEGGTKYEPSLSVVSDWLAGRAVDSHVQGANTTTVDVRHGHDFDSRVFFLTDGGNNNSAGGWDPTHGKVEDLYSNVGAISGDLHNVTIRSVGFGLDHSSKFYGNLDQTDDNVRNGSVHTVDSTASAGQLQEGFGVVNAAQVVTGSVLHNDVTGNDAHAHVVGFTYNGVNYTADSAVGGAVVSNAHGLIEIHTAIGGDFQFNFATGQYTYHAPGADVATEAQEVFRYTLADSTGATSSANLTIHVEPSSNANGGFEYGNLIDWDAAGSAWVTDQDQHGGGHYSAVLGTNNSGPNTTPYSSDTLANFVGANASDLAHLTPQATGTGSVLKTTLNVDPNSGHQISLDFNFLTDEGSAGSTNDFAFVAINGKLHLLSDAHNTSGTVAAVNSVGQDGFSRSTGWHTATIDVSQADSHSGHLTVAVGVMNAGINGAMGHDSALHIDNVHAMAQAHA